MDEVVEVAAVVADVVVLVVVEAVPSTHLQIDGFELHGQY